VPSIPQNQEVSPKSRLQAVYNEALIASSAEGTPCHSEDELDDLPDVNKRTKRLSRRQDSREGQG